MRCSSRRPQGVKMKLESISELRNRYAPGCIVMLNVQSLGQCTRDIASLLEMVDMANVTIARLTVENKRLQEDAERWRCVLRNPWSAIGRLTKGCGIMAAYWEKEANEAIDAARKGT